MGINKISFNDFFYCFYITVNYFNGMTTHEGTPLNFEMLSRCNDFFRDVWRPEGLSRYKGPIPYENELRGPEDLLVTVKNDEITCQKPVHDRVFIFEVQCSLMWSDKSTRRPDLVVDLNHTANDVNCHKLYNVLRQNTTEYGKQTRHVYETGHYPQKPWYRFCYYIMKIPTFLLPYKCPKDVNPLIKALHEVSNQYYLNSFSEHHVGIPLIKRALPKSVAVAVK